MRCAPKLRSVWKRLLFITLLATTPSFAEPFRATLEKVWDGDTIDVLDDRRHLVRVRLRGIDAPERRQPFGDEARESLQRFLSDCPLVISGESHDRYGRLVAKVTCGGRDAGLEQVASGFAWVYPAPDSMSEDDRRRYAAEQRIARNLGSGLWRDDAIPPWEFRREESGRLARSERPSPVTSASTAPRRDRRAPVRAGSASRPGPRRSARPTGSAKGRAAASPRG